MKEAYERITHEQFEKIIETLNPCMNDYLFILDLKDSYYCISPSALERFPLESSHFYFTKEATKEFMYPDDLPGLLQEIEDIKAGKKHFHNMQYRWLDREGNPVWINCRGRLWEGQNGKKEYLVGCINEIARARTADNVSGLLGNLSFQKELEEKDMMSLRGFLVRVGIDNFKEINETHGMEYGDMILRETAKCVQRVIWPDEKLYKIVADEFIIADFNGRDISKAVDLYEKIQQEINRFIIANGYGVG